MAKQLNCGDLMAGCKAVFTGNNETEVMTKAAAHAKKDHGIETIPPELVTKVRKAIKEVQV